LSRKRKKTPDACALCAGSRTLVAVKAVSSRKSAEPVEELVRRHQGAVRGYLIVLGCPGRLLDDLIQDTFLSMLSSGFEDRGQASTAAFLRKVARHLFLKTMQRERRQLDHADLLGSEQAWSGFERDDGGERYLVALRECLARLRERTREVILMRYRDQLQQAAIASRLGLSASGVKSILVRTRRALRECVERRLAT
jgi:RNA polymerase sigma-70 factor (ECF subfamily)